MCSERRILLRFLAAPVPEFGVATSRGSEGDHGCSDTTGTPAKGGPCHLSPCLLPLPSFRSKSQRNGSTRFLPLLGWSKAESPHVRCSITVASINSGTVPWLLTANNIKEKKKKKKEVHLLKKTNFETACCGLTQQAAKGAEQPLALGGCCSATTDTSVCCQHCSHPQSKARTRTSY